MCNPRRVTITATNELQEAWQRAVTRTAQLSAQVVGEARVRQPLAPTLSRQALAALELALDDDDDWRELEDGSFRCDVEGGYALYHADGQELEIVAVREDRVAAEGAASETLEGTLRGTVEAQGEGRYYDDEWGGHSRDRAEQRAEQEAQKRLEEARRQAVAQAEQAAEEAASESLQQRAEDAAQAELARTAEATRAELETRAREQLAAVGLRARQAFHRVLARGYRDALLAYARSQGAEITTNQDDDGVLDIELQWSR